MLPIASLLFFALLSSAGAIFLYLGVTGGMPGLRLLLRGRPVVLVFGSYT